MFEITKRFMKYTFFSLKQYLRGLFPRTFVSTFTDPQCRKILYVEKTWMGEEISYRQYPLAEIDLERMKAEKKNLPRIQKIISDYEGEHGEITAGKTEMSRISDKTGECRHS